MSTYRNGPGNVPELPYRVVHTLIDKAGVSCAAPGSAPDRVRNQTANVVRLVHDACEELLARLPASTLPGRAELVQFIDGYCAGKSEMIALAEAAFFWFNKCAAGQAPCVICGANEPRTGTCGSDDARALCNRAPQANSPEQQSGCGGTGKSGDTMPCLGCDSCPPRDDGSATAPQPAGEQADAIVTHVWEHVGFKERAELVAEVAAMLDQRASSARADATPLVEVGTLHIAQDESRIPAFSWPGPQLSAGEHTLYVKAGKSPVTTPSSAAPADVLEDAARIAESYGSSRPIVARNPGSLIQGRWEGEQAASRNIAAAIRALGARQA